VIDGIHPPPLTQVTLGIPALSVGLAYSVQSVIRPAVKWKRPILICTFAIGGEAAV
jgi:hypothetical protein